MLILSDLISPLFSVVSGGDVELVLVLYPPVEALGVECIDVRHDLNVVPLDCLVWLHQALYATRVLLLLFIFLFFVHLSILKHLLDLLLELISREEWDHVVCQRAPLIILLLHHVAYELVALVREHVEATVRQVGANLH